MMAKYIDRRKHIVIEKVQEIDFDDCSVDEVIRQMSYLKSEYEEKYIDLIIEKSYDHCYECGGGYNLVLMGVRKENASEKRSRLKKIAREKEKKSSAIARKKKRLQKEAESLGMTLQEK
jgi:hypothetical protein